MPPSFPSTTTAYAQLHDAIRTSVPTNSPQPLTLIQISHAGLQSSSTMNLSRAPWVRAIAPTSARPDTGTSAMGWVMGRALWPVQSREMVDPEEWVGVVRAFVRVAEIAEEAGWGGAQVHSAHGYLLAEYLSPLVSLRSCIIRMFAYLNWRLQTNPDPLPLPGVPERIPLRLHLLYLILVGIDAATDPGFVKGVKINCSDFVQGGELQLAYYTYCPANNLTSGLDEEQSTTLVKEIISWKLVDVLEISGGNYSSPGERGAETLSKSQVFLMAETGS